MARLDSVADTNEYAKSGVMMRESLAADSRFAAMAVEPTDATYFMRRTAAGATAAPRLAASWRLPG